MRLWRPARRSRMKSPRTYRSVVSASWSAHTVGSKINHNALKRASSRSSTASNQPSVVFGIVPASPPAAARSSARAPSPCWLGSTARTRLCGIKNGLRRAMALTIASYSKPTSVGGPANGSNGAWSQSVGLKAANAVLSAASAPNATIPSWRRCAMASTPAATIASLTSRVPPMPLTPIRLAVVG